mgnify:CR=1 FL=1
MLPDCPPDNEWCCFIIYQLAQWRPPRSYAEILNSNLPSGKSMPKSIGIWEEALFGEIMNQKLRVKMEDKFKQLN